MSQEKGVESFGYKQELKRSLTVTDMVIYGLICMVPIAPMGVYGFVFETSKGMVVAAYLIGLIGMLFTAASYAKMSNEFPIAGSVYSYASRGLHSYAGFIAGWLMILDYILVPALLYVVAAVGLRTMLPEIPSFIWVLVFVVLNTFINILGIQMTARTNKIILACQIVVLAIFGVVTAWAVSRGVNNASFTMDPIFQPGVFTIALVVGATSTAVLSFLGFDSIATLAEESTGGSKSVGKAAVLALVIISIFFVVQTYLAALIEPNLTQAIADGKTDADNAFYYVALLAGGRWLMIMTILAVVVAWGFANSLGIQAATARILFSMARDGYLPRPLSKVHPRYKSPYMSTIVVAVISIGAAAFFFNALDSLVHLVNFGALSSFLILHVAVIYYFLIKKKSTNYFAYLVMPIIGILIVGYIWINLGSLAFIYGFSWLVIGFILLAIISKGFKTTPKLEV